MGSPIVRKYLDTALDTVCQISEITAAVRSDAASDEIESAIARRAHLVKKFAHGMESLEASAPGWQAEADSDPRLRAQMRQIELLAASVIEADRTLAAYIERRICEIEERLKGLAATAPAARSYTAHSFPARPARGYLKNSL